MRRDERGVHLEGPVAESDRHAGDDADWLGHEPSDDWNARRWLASVRLLALAAAFGVVFWGLLAYLIYRLVT